MGLAQSSQPGLLLRAAPVTPGLDEVGAPGGVEGLGRRPFARIGQSLLGVLADRLEQPIGRREVGTRGGDDHRLVDQAAEQLERVGHTGTPAIGCAPHGHGPRQVDTAPVDGEPTEEASLVRGEQLVAPVDRGSHRAVALGRPLGAARGQIHPAVQAGHDLAQRQAAQSGGCQLDRERKSIEPPTQRRRHRRGMRRTGRGRAVLRPHDRPGSASRPPPGSPSRWHRPSGDPDPRRRGRSRPELRAPRGWSRGREAPVPPRAGRRRGRRPSTARARSCRGRAGPGGAGDGPRCRRPAARRVARGHRDPGRSPGSRNRRGAGPPAR